MSKFVKGQRVRYTGTLCLHLKNRVGTVTDPDDTKGWVEVQFDGQVTPSLCYPGSLTVELPSDSQIIIDETGPDWEPGTADAYFAQRGPQGQFAFGPTPQAALEALLAAEAVA